jgi:small-conductance mechanosensitive channel
VIAARIPVGVGARDTLRAAVTVVALLCVVSLPGLSQEQVPPPGQQVGADSVRTPRPIPAVELPERAENTTSELRTIQSGLAPSEGVRRIQDQVSGVLDSLAAQRATVDTAVLARLSQRRLSDTEQHWRRNEALLSRWSETVADYSVRLEASNARLDSIRAEWQVTRDSAAATGLPQALIERVGLVLSLVDSTRVELRARRDSVLELQDRLSQSVVSVREVLTVVDAEQVARGERIWSRDSEPLWTALGAPPDSVTVTTRLRNAWQDNIAAVRNYARMSDAERELSLTVFLALLLVTTVLRYRAKKWDMQDPDLSGVVHFLNRPIASALLLTLLTTAFIYPTPPAAVSTAKKLVGIAPVLLLLPSSVYRRMGGVIYGAAGLFVVHQLYKISLDQSLVQRLLLLAITAAALAACVCLRVHERRAVTAGELHRWINGAAGIGAITLATSLFANVWGVVALAELLTAATLDAIYALLVLYAAAEIVTGLYKLALRSRLAQSLNSVRKNRNLLARRGTKLIGVAALLVWIWAALEAFQSWEAALRVLTAVLNAELSVGAFALSLGDVVAFVVTMWIALQLSRIVRSVMAEDVLSRARLARGVPGAISTLVHYTIIALGFFAAISAAGIELSRLALIAGGLGVGVGFGLKDLVNNFVSGLVLAFERPIQIGDVVELGGFWGTVRRIGMRSSTIRAFSGSEVIVPNATLTTTEVVNWTLTDEHRRLEIPVGVAYGSDPQRVLDLLLDTADKHEEILKYPAPAALFVGFGDSSLNFKLKCWAAEFNEGLRLSSELTLMIHAALRAEGIEIPFPQRDLHLRSVSDSVAGNR